MTEKKESLKKTLENTIDVFDKYDKRGSGGVKPIISTYVGEICSECGEARMLHPQLYVYTCPYCRYSYMVQPCSSPFSRGIVVLKQSKVRKSFKKRK